MFVKKYLPHKSWFSFLSQKINLPFFFWIFLSHTLPSLPRDGYPSLSLFVFTSFPVVSLLPPHIFSVHLSLWAADFCPLTFLLWDFFLLLLFAVDTSLAVSGFRFVVVILAFPVVSTKRCRRRATWSSTLLPQSFLKISRSTFWWC
jgi:hypothetical protein